MPLASLRLVISAVAALSVAVVAAITLSLTLTSSLSALRTVGRGQAEALLGTALLRSEQLFAVPQDTAETLQNLTRSEDWPWPSDDPTTLDYFRNTSFGLFVNSRWRLNSMVLYFADNTQLLLSNYYEPDRVFQWPGDYYGVIASIPSPLSAAGGNRSLQDYNRPEEVIIRHGSNYSVFPRSDPRTYEIIPPGFNPGAIYGTSIWNNQFMLGTSGGLINVNAGVYNVQMFGVVENFITFLVPLRRKSDPVVANGELYGFALMALGFDDLNTFMQQVRATPNTAAFAVDSLGYLMATSANTPFTVNTVAPPNSVIRPGCTATERSGGVSQGADNVISCRTHASAYGNAALSAYISANVGALPTDPTVTLLDAGGDAGVYFAASGRVSTRFRGPTTHLIVLVPEEDVIGDVVRSRNVAIGITCGVFVIVAAVAFAVITALLAPLDTIAERMHKASNFEDDGADETVSAMAEVAALQEAYYAMNAELNRIRSFVPQSVLVAKRAEQQDDEDDVSEGELSVRPDEKSPSQSVRNDASSTASRSSPRSNASSVHRRAALAARGMGTAAFGLQSRTATVLIVNAAGFGQTTHGLGAGRVTEVLAELVTLVEEAVSGHGGVLGSFHGDHFTATFNAARPCIAHTRKACSVAHQLTHCPVTSRSLSLKAGIASGPCLVGNVGSSAAKVFATVGPAFAQALALERLTRMYGGACRTFITSRIAADVATHYRFRYVDIVHLPGRSTAALLAALVGPVDSSKANSVNLGGNGVQPSAGGGGGGGGADDEWLYLVGDQAASDRNGAHNAAFDALLAMNLPACEKYASTLGGAATATPDIDADGAVAEGKDAHITDRFRELVAAATAASPPEDVADVSMEDGIPGAMTDVAAATTTPPLALQRRERPAPPVSDYGAFYRTVVARHA